MLEVKEEVTRPTTSEKRGESTLLEKLSKAKEEFLQKQFKKTSKQLIKAVRRGRYRLKKKFEDPRVALDVQKRLKEVGVRSDVLTISSGSSEPSRSILIVFTD